MLQGSNQVCSWLPFTSSPTGKYSFNRRPRESLQATSFKSVCMIQCPTMLGEASQRSIRQSGRISWVYSAARYTATSNIRQRSPEETPHFVSFDGRASLLVGIIISTGSVTRLEFPSHMPLKGRNSCTKFPVRNVPTSRHHPTRNYPFRNISLDVKC